MQVFLFPSALGNRQPPSYHLIVHPPSYIVLRILIATPMSSTADFIEYIAAQTRDAGQISYRKMFGEYALYCDTKVIALVCDDQLFIKPTEAGKKHIGQPVEAPPYDGAKMYYLIEDTDDGEWLSELVRLTASELPQPKPKKAKNHD